MLCPKCKGKLGVIDNVNAPDNELYRLRRCKECGHTIYTIEYEADADKYFLNRWDEHHRNRHRNKKEKK